MDRFLHDLREATADVERQLALEDRGWMRSGGNAGMSAAERVENVRMSRIYAAHDPLCRQAIRLWTDYTFGTGMGWTCEDEGVQRVLQAYWEHRPNRPLLSAAGQRRSNDQLMVDGEVFFCLFPSPDGRATVRRIDPLEITEFVTDPDDQESVRYYRRDWTTPQGQTRTGYYRSSGNLEDEPCPSAQGREVTADQEGIVFHFAYNSLGERGVPLLLPVLEWVRLYRRFMASRVAIMLAMSRFAWRLKSGGGPADVAAAQGAMDGQTVAAGSIWTENAGVELTPIKADSGAGQAYQDGRMLKLQIFAGTGWPEQYFADVSCYSEDTEVLTDDGWMLHKDWRPGIKVAAFNPQSRSLEYLDPLELRVFDYHGDMVHFEQAHADILVTPNHRMWAAKHTNWQYQPPRAAPSRGGRRSISEGGAATLDRSWQFYTARDILLSQRTNGWRFENTVASYAGNGYRPPFEHNERDWAMFLGYWLSEGYCLSDTNRNGEKRSRGFYRIGISQKPSPTLGNMRSVLTRLGYTAHEQHNQGGVATLVINNKALWGYLREECGRGSHDKRVPAGILHASSAVRHALLEALIEGDGGHANGQHTGGRTYSSVSKALADDVMALALSLGYATSIRQETKQYNGAQYPIWRVSIRDRRKGNLIYPYMVHAEPYQGAVYCFALPKHHIYVTRRNGRVAIQGNTGNLATAQTVELPVTKMIQSLQACWRDVYAEMDECVLRHAGVRDTVDVDRDFPAIVPEDQVALASALQQIVQSFPDLADSRDVLQQALMSIGVLDTNRVIDELEQGRDERRALRQAEGGAGDPALALSQALSMFRASLKPEGTDE